MFSVGEVIVGSTLCFQIVDQIHTKLPVFFVEKLLAPDSQLLKLRLHREKEVCECVTRWHYKPLYLVVKDVSQTKSR